MDCCERSYCIHASVHSRLICAMTHSRTENKEQHEQNRITLSCVADYSWADWTCKGVICSSRISIFPLEWIGFIFSCCCFSSFLYTNNWCSVYSFFNFHLKSFTCKLISKMLSFHFNAIAATVNVTFKSDRIF